MSADAWFTIAVCAAVLVTLAFWNISADLVMLAALTLLLTAGVIGPADALAGFANEGAVTVGVLFVVAAALRETGGVAWAAQVVLGRPRSVVGAQARLMFPTAFMSAFMNNTPLVAMMLPVVTDWGKRIGISPSRLLMPLSFATILGGLCTLIGTSTNIVVHGLLARHQQHHDLAPANGHYGLGMFDITLVGGACAIAGLLYMLLTSRWLLVDRTPAVSLEADPREYTVEMTVEAGSPLVGQNIEQAGLRQLPGLYLMEIEREGEVFPAISPEQRLEANDRLVFVGIVDSVVELQRIRGLRPATNQVFKLSAPRANRSLVEAVVSSSCRLVGQSIREGRFRAVYNAVVIAVARDGKRVNRKIGDIVLEPGDTLLLEAQPSFAEAHRNSRDFYLVSRLEDSSPPKHDKAWVALAILAGMVVTAGMEWLSMLNAALLAGGLMVITRCITGTMARRAVDWQILLVIGAALGVGRAMEVTGAASGLASYFIGVAGANPWMCLAVIYALTMVFTEVMSNNAAAALMFPVAMATSASLGVDFMPFVIVVMIAASCGFATPIGYQTNLMVFGPGGYRFSDFLRFGGLLNLLVGIVAVLVTPLVWPF